MSEDILYTDSQAKRNLRDSQIIQRFKETKGAIGARVKALSASNCLSESMIRNILRKHKLIGK